MKLEDIQNALSKIKYGRYFKVHYRSVDEKTGYAKETTTIGRFVDYSHIKGVEPKGKANPNDTYTIKHKLVYNKNKDAYYLSIAVVNIPNYHSHSDYEDAKGNAITKDEYLQNVKVRKSNGPKTVWKLNIDKVISIG